MRKLGDILLDLEDVLTELIEDHDLQTGEVLGLTKSYIDIHHPHATEEYEDGSSPVYYYGAKK